MIRTPQLVGAYCTKCDARAGTVLIESGPVLVRHYREWRYGGARHRCRQDFVAVPNRVARSVQMIIVVGHQEIEAVLREQGELWLGRMAREIELMLGDAQAISDVYGVTTMPGLKP